MYPKPRKGTVPLQGTSISRRVREAVTKAGLVDEKGKPKTSAHGLRATGITLVADRVGIEIASRMAGHSRIATTEAKYASKVNVEPQRPGADVFSR